MKASLVRKQPENSAKNIITFWFEPEKPLDQIAGQYVELTLRHDKPDKRGEKRWFTLSSSPTETPLISITTKLSSPGSSFKQQLLGLKAGQQVLVSDPLGDFVLPKDASVPLLFVAAGIGITPFRSILKSLLDSNLSRQIDLIYLVAASNELIFQSLLRKFKPRQIITNNLPVSAKDLLGLVDLDPRSLIFIAGPETFTEAMAKQFVDLKINRSQLVLDLFTGYELQD